MVGLYNGLCQVGLIEDRDTSIGTIRQTHPVERGDIQRFCLFHPIICKFEELILTDIIVGLTRSTIHIAGPPFSNDNRYVELLDDFGVNIAEDPVNLALSGAETA